MKLQARALGQTQLHPADLFAPAPTIGTTTAMKKKQLMPYEDAIELIANAVSKVDPSMAEIVKMMAAEGWIEGTSGASKSPGAYCTGFPKQREPRVYLSEFAGTMTNVSTLAHELGHAYHSWVSVIGSLSTSLAGCS